MDRSDTVVVFILLAFGIGYSIFERTSENRAKEGEKTKAELKERTEEERFKKISEYAQTLVKVGETVKVTESYDGFGGRFGGTPAGSRKTDVLTLPYPTLNQVRNVIGKEDSREERADLTICVWRAWGKESLTLEFDGTEQLVSLVRSQGPSATETVGRTSVDWSEREGLH